MIPALIASGIDAFFVKALGVDLPARLAFGWLYMRRGLEAAILSHFVIDVIVHVVRPIVENGRT